MWYWNLIIVIAFILVLWWALTRQAALTETPAVGGEHAPHEHPNPEKVGSHDDLNI